MFKCNYSTEKNLTYLDHITRLFSMNTKNERERERERQFSNRSFFLIAFLEQSDDNYT